MDWITIVAGGNNLKEVNLWFTGLSSCGCVDRKHLPLPEKEDFSQSSQRTAAADC